MKQYLFKLLIAFDRLINVLTFGDFGTCISTRIYVNRVNNPSLKRWAWFETIVDKLFWAGHCKDSYHWERKQKLQWLEKHKLEG